MNPEVEFLFDDVTPFSYLANLQIEGFAKRNGGAVTYTPIQLGRGAQGDRKCVADDGSSEGTLLGDRV
jgi:2-hydroxychromene-2-carboxylate isomerase